MHHTDCITLTHRFRICDTISVPGTPSSETAKMQSSGSLASCQFPSFSGPPQCCLPVGVIGFSVLFSPFLPLQLGWSWKLATQHMVAPQHNIWYLPSGPGSYVCHERLSSWEEPYHPLLIGCILFCEHSYIYVSGFSFLWHASQFCKPISVFHAIAPQI